MKLSTFVNRLKRIGIYIEMSVNYPWVYLTRVDDHWIKEKRDSDWGFVLGYSKGGGNIDMLDTKELFNIIRKYSKRYSREKKINKILE